MDPTDRAHLERFGKLVTVLFRAYGTPIDEDTIEGWFAALQDLDLDRLEAACRVALRSETRLPSPARVRELAGRSASSEAGDAFLAMREHIRSGYRTKVSDTIRATVRLMGGWRRIGDMDPERLQAFGRREWDAAFEEVRGRGPADAERLAREDDRPPVRLCSGGRLEELHPISEQAQADERLGKLFEGDAPEDPILEGLLRRALAGDAEALRRLPGYLNATDASETTRADALRRLSEGA